MQPALKHDVVRSAETLAPASIDKAEPLTPADMRMIRDLERVAHFARYVPAICTAIVTAATLLIILPAMGAVLRRLWQ
jgi:hypothetical protein